MSSYRRTPSAASAAAPCARGGRARIASSGAIEQAARRWTVRLASREIGPRELERFEAWLAERSEHKAAFDRARATWLAVGRLDPERAPAISTSLTPRSGRPLRRLAPLAAAACVVAGGTAFAHENWAAWTSDVVASEAVRRVQLPDGSLAVLDAGAALDLEFADGRRRVRVKEGRVWIKPRPIPGRPFEAEGGGLHVSGQTGAFVIDRMRGQGEVTAVDGPISARGPGDPGSVLVAANTARAYTGAGGRTAVAREASTAWQDGRLVIDGLSVREALAQIDRYRPGRLIVVDVPHTSVNAAFFLDDLDAGLEALAAAQDLEMTRVAPGLTVVTRAAPGDTK